MQDSRPPWASVDTTNAKPPGAFTITQLRHYYELYKTNGDEGDDEANLSGLQAASAMSSVAWLRKYSLDAQGITLQALINMGHIVFGAPEAGGDGGKFAANLPPDSSRAASSASSGFEEDAAGEHKQKKIEFSAADTDMFEYRVHSAMDRYGKRIKWLFQGSRRAFGLLQGKNIALVVDCSDANLAVDRLANFQQMFLHLIDEQLADKKTVFPVLYATDAQPLWPAAMPVNERTLDELKVLAQNVKPFGGSNLLHALKLVAPRLRNIDTLVLVVGSLPDQDVELILDYLNQVAHLTAPLDDTLDRFGSMSTAITLSLIVLPNSLFRTIIEIIIINRRRPTCYC